MNSFYLYKQVYVQDIVKKNSVEVFNLIFNRKGHFYICGDVKMAEEVTKTLENVLRVNGNMSSEDSKNYIDDMKVGFEYVFDIDLLSNILNRASKRKLFENACGDLFVFLDAFRLQI